MINKPISYLSSIIGVYILIQVVEEGINVTCPIKMTFTNLGVKSTSRKSDPDFLSMKYGHTERIQARYP
jgi:hypothetical protein